MSPLNRVQLASAADQERLSVAVNAAGTRAYVCRGTTCSAPIESLADLARQAAARVD